MIRDHDKQVFIEPLSKISTPIIPAIMNSRGMGSLVMYRHNLMIGQHIASL